MNTTKKYSERPSPPYKASEYKNKSKKGNDGKNYKSVKDINGVYKWKKVEQKKCKKYYTLDNGAKSFLVEDYDKSVIIYKMNDLETKKLKEIKYKEIYFGKVPPKIINQGYVYKKGNSILLHINNNKYMLIGNTILLFTTINKEKIIKFISPIGNSEVSYPYAIGENYTYLFIEKIAIENSALDLTSDVYGQYYENIKSYKNSIKKIVMKNL